MSKPSKNKTPLAGGVWTSFSNESGTDYSVAASDGDSLSNAGEIILPMDNADQPYFADNSSAAQRHRLLDALYCAPVSTLQARKSLDILMPGTRVFELRAMGYPIDTIRVKQPTDSGKLHTVALYVLQSNPKGDA